MGLINKTQEQYYADTQSFVGNGTDTDFILNFDPPPQTKDLIQVFVDDVLVLSDDYTLFIVGSPDPDPTLLFDVAPADGADILVKLLNKPRESYRFTSLKDLVNNFIVMYVGPGKILNRVNRREVVAHVRRIIQEFSFDISRVEKIQEIEVDHTLSMIIPQDFVEVVEVSWVDDNGIEHPIPETRITSNPSQAILQDERYEYLFDEDGNLLTTDPITRERWMNTNSSSADRLYENSSPQEMQHFGGRFGGNPELMNANGSYQLDEANNKITFSSNIIGSIITLKYISDGLGTDEEMRIHKFAEKAVYSTAVLNMLESLEDVQEYVIRRWRRQSSADKANAKIRLSRLAPKDLMSIMRKASKVIKH